jgi:hypothetical protein
LNTTDPSDFTDAIVALFRPNAPLAAWLKRMLRITPPFPGQTYLHASALQAVLRGVLAPATIPTLTLPNIDDVMAPSTSANTSLVQAAAQPPQSPAPGSNADPGQKPDEAPAKQR